MRQIDEATRIYRGIRRRVNNGRPLDSFPFLSGDSYLFSCEYFFQSGHLQKIPARSGRIQKPWSVFVRLGDINEFVNYLHFNAQVDYSNHSVVLHNGDDSVARAILEKLSERFKRVYSVNLLSKTEKLSPIPIGLENRNLFTNGVPRDFIKLVSSTPKNFEGRKNLVLQAFSLHTNKVERESCAAVASRLKISNLRHTTPLEYRKALSDSRFVLSPAGNGIDCHRTWESMYLGAIPIVKSAHWPFIDLSLPVLVIDEWSDLLNIDLESVSVPQNLTWDKDFWDDFFNE